MKRFTHIFLLIGLSAYGCSDSDEPLAPTDVTAATQSSVLESPTPGPQMALAQEANLGPVLKFNGRAEFADASFFSMTETGYRFGYAYVFQEQGGGSQETGLGYDITECDLEFFYCETTEAGFGTIPSGDVVFGRNSVRLSTDTGADANPGFFRFLGEGGLLEVTWTATPFFSTSRVSNERSQYGSIKVRSHDSSDYTSAMAEANLFSQELVGDGSFGSSRTSQIEISVGGVVAAASGSGHVTVDGEERTFSFHALQRADGRVGGSWQRFNRAQDARAHGTITCMSVSGGTAWLGGISTKSTTALGPVRWRVSDGGKGGGDDAISLQNIGAAADVDAYCFGQPDFPDLIPVEAGNVSIRP